MECWERHGWLRVGETWLATCWERHGWLRVGRDMVGYVLGETWLATRPFFGSLSVVFVFIN